jgi:hypothetical protein
MDVIFTNAILIGDLASAARKTGIHFRGIRVKVITECADFEAEVDLGFL